MKKVFIVRFWKEYLKRWIIDDVFLNESTARDYVSRWNDWEKSEDGSGDFWDYTEAFLHEE